jgi:hypothetical protein
MRGAESDVACSSHQYRGLTLDGLEEWVEAAPLSGPAVAIVALIATLHRLWPLCSLSEPAKQTVRMTGPSKFS